MILSLAACGGKTNDNAGDNKPATEGEKDAGKEPEKKPEENEASEKEVVLRKAYYADHGEKAKAT